MQAQFAKRSKQTTIDTLLDTYISVKTENSQPLHIQKIQVGGLRQI